MVEGGGVDPELGLIETLRVVQGQARYLDLHWERLCLGMRRLGISHPGLRSQLQAAVADSADGVLRAEVHHRSVGYTHRPAPEEPSAIAVGRVAVPVPEEPATAGLKTTAREVWDRAREEAGAQGWDEGLVATVAGHRICGTHGNLFLRVEGRWLTPRLDRAGVAGVMRRVLIPVLRARLLRVDDELLARAERMLLCNAVRGARWVSSYEGRALEVTDEDRRLLAGLAPGRRPA